MEKEKDLEGTDPAGALLRVFLWLGLEEHQSNWAKSAAVKEVAVFAERYRNQVWPNSYPSQFLYACTNDID